MKPLVFGFVLVAASLAQAAAPVAPSPWAQVPAFPTSCYSSKDDFVDKIAAAREVVAGEIDQRRQANNELYERAKEADSGDDETRRARMQAMMMKDPQATMKMMQGIQGAGNAMNAAAPADNANQQKLDRELKDLQTQYRAALANAVAPVQARIVKRFQPDGSGRQGFLANFGQGYADADFADYAALNQQWNAEHEKACAPWFQASGPFHAWLKRYHDHLVQDHIPSAEKLEQQGYEFRAMMAGSPPGSIQPTAQLEAVSDYLKRAEEIFNSRPLEPRMNMYQ